VRSEKSAKNIGQFWSTLSIGGGVGGDGEVKDKKRKMLCIVQCLHSLLFLTPASTIVTVIANQQLTRNAIFVVANAAFQISWTIRYYQAISFA